MANEETVSNEICFTLTGPKLEVEDAIARLRATFRLVKAQHKLEGGWFLEDISSKEEPNV